MPRWIAPLLLASLLLGCGPKNELVGTWRSSTKAGPVTYEFTNAGVVNRTYGIEEMKLTMVGDYKIEGRSLSVVQTDLRFEGGPDGDAHLSKKGKAVLNKSEPEKWTFAFEGKDTLKIKEEDGQEVVLTRG